MRTRDHDKPARLLAADNKVGRASATIENAWKAVPHPALWLAYRDLKTAETPRERATSATLTPGCNDNFKIFSFSEIGCQRRTRRGLTSKPSAMCRSSRSTRFAARRESSYTYESLPHESLMVKAL